MEDDLNFKKMEDDLIFFKNGRRPQSFGIWQMTSIFIKWKNSSIFGEMEDDLNIYPNGRRPHFWEDGKQPQLVGK
jgi:hypothetical protein